MHEVVRAVFGMAGLLGLASLLVPLSKRLYLPYTVLLAIGGGIVGLLVLNVGEATGPLSDFLNALKSTEVSAEILLYVFLPPLLFAGGLSIDVRRLMDDIWPVLLLAIVAVGLCFLAVGWAVHLTSGQGLILCFLLGAIVATTDTAAVLNIFRDIGAPKRLSILVEGESLFNDAAAIALFGVLLGMLMTGNADWAGGAWSLVRGLVGGVIFGYVIARLVVAIIPFLRGAVLTEITLTVTLAYVTFVAAEAYFHVSGIIAVVAAAITFSGSARTKLSPGTWDILRAIWRQLDFWATTLIFVLAAMMAPGAVAGLTWMHGFALVALYFAAIGARAIVLFGLMPILTHYRLAGHIDNRYKLVLLWGAMRGAITVALALAVAERDDALADEQRSFVWIMAVGFVLATLFINAPTLRFLMRSLKLDFLDPHEKLIRDRVMELSRSRVNDQVNALAVQFGIPLSPELKLEVGRGDHSHLSHSDRLKVGLFALANQEAELTLDYLERGMIDRHIAESLIAHAGRIVDGLKTMGIEGYTPAWRRSYAMTPRFRGSLWLQRRFGLTGPIANEIADRFELLLVKERLLQDLVEFSRTRVVPIVGQDVAQELDTMLRDRIQAISGAIEGLDLQYPEYAASVRQLFLVRMSLGLEEAEYRTQLDQAMISTEVFEDLEADLRRRTGQLRARPKLDLGLRLATMLAKVPLFTRLTQADLAELAKLLTPQIAIPDEKIIEAGERGDRMYFIAAGSVDVAIRNPPITLGPGDFFGEMALILDQPRNADVIARAYCNLLVLRRNDFERYVRAHPSIEREIEAVAKARYAANTKAA
jgi:CPA1 family monovalent cation:H+ antiporter